MWNTESVNKLKQYKPLLGMLLLGMPIHLGLLFIDGKAALTVALLHLLLNLPSCQERCASS